MMGMLDLNRGGKKMARKKKPKVEILTPKMPKRREDMAKKTGVTTKRSVVVHKKDEKAENLYHIIGQLQEQITELTRMYGELPDSKHKGVGGMMKPTLKQKVIAEQLKRAEGRLDRMTRLLEKQYK